MVLETFRQKRRLAQSRTKQLYPISTRIGAPVVILCLNLNRKQKPENGVLPFFLTFAGIMCLLTRLDLFAYMKVYKR